MNGVYHAEASTAVYFTQFTAIITIDRSLTKNTSLGQLIENDKSITMSLLPFFLPLLLLPFAFGTEEPLSSSLVAAPSPTSSIEAKCSNDIMSLMDCLSYATGKSDKPSDKCCGTVSDIRKNDPVCLCYAIQQSQNVSSPSIYNMGLKIDRLVQLPAACKIHNANITDCPKLLGLPPDSPDNALFNGSAITAMSTAANATTAGNTTTMLPSFGLCVEFFRNFNSALVSVILLCLFFVG